MSRDFSEFEGKLAWTERQVLIQERFPRLKSLDWKKAFDRDIDLFARVLRDILKLDQAQPGRPGPRPALDVPRATKTVKQLMGEDYSELAFVEAFRVLVANRSHRQVAARTGLDRNQIQRLLWGKVQPSIHDMTAIAEAYGKRADYFTEYRAVYIREALMSKIMASPETNIGIYRRLAVGT